MSETHFWSFENIAAPLHDIGAVHDMIRVLCAADVNTTHGGLTGGGRRILEIIIFSFERVELGLIYVYVCEFKATSHLLMGLTPRTT